MEPAPVRVGVLGCGNVGAALLILINEQHAEVARRTGLALEVGAVAVRDPGRDRNVPVDPGLFTDDPASVVANPEIEVVVEVMGGIDPAHRLVAEALERGKPVVTANKELLASHGSELYALAEGARVDLLFEAAVAGAIPIMRLLRESLAGEPITRVMGIVNGTTNFILSRMAEEAMPYGEALAEAQRLGYAEADPTADVEGIDAAAKAAIMASLAFGVRVTADDVFREGISSITSEDIEFAGRLDHCIKLLAIAERRDAGDGLNIGVRVHPAMVPLDHPLASVRDSFNAVFVEGEAVGELMFYGRGAGGRPTASAVLGDLVNAAGNLRRSHGARIGDLQPAVVTPIEELESAYYLEVEVDDRPGVLSRVAAVFGDHDVSIRSMEQEGLGVEARLIFITHTARERDLRATLEGLDGLDAVRSVGSMLRVVGD